MATHKTYTQEQKNKALQLMEQVGPQKAAKQLGIATGSLYTWRNAKDAAKQVTAKTKPQGKGKGALAAKEIAEIIERTEALTLIKVAKSLMETAQIKLN